MASSVVCMMTPPLLGKGLGVAVQKNGQIFVSGILSVLSFDVQWRGALAQEEGFTVSRTEWIMGFPGGFRRRERKALGRGRGRAKKPHSFLKLEVDGSVCHCRLWFSQGFILDIYPSVLFF